MNALGKRLSQLREAAGLNQSELARRARIAQPTLWAIESGKAKQPRWATIVALADALRCSPVYLSTGTGEDVQLTDDLKELLAVFAKMTPAQRQALIAMIKAAGEK